MYMHIYIVNVALTSARCDTVFHIRRLSSDRSDLSEDNLDLLVNHHILAIDEAS